MYKLHYRDPVEQHAARTRFFRGFATAMIAFFLFLIAIGFAAEAAASPMAFPKPDEPMNFFWPVLGVVAFGVAMYFSRLPCDPIYNVDPWLEPSQPWRKTADEAPIPLATEELLPVKDLLYPNYRTRASDKPGFVERRKHDRVPTTDAHRDDHAILMLTFSMKQKLQATRQAKMNLDHHNKAAVSLEELEQALLVAMRSGDLIDIANHVMFLHERGVRHITAGVRKPETTT